MNTLEIIRQKELKSRKLEEARLLLAKLHAKAMY